MYLRNNCYLVNGYHNSAIYDLNNRKVYSVNKSGRNLLEKYLKHDKIVGDKNKRHDYIEVEPFEKHLNELIIQRKRILADMKERKMKKDFK